MDKKIRIAAIIFLLAIILYQPIITNFKIILFITEEFPQIPIKPLGIFTGKPSHKKVELDSENGKIVGDLFIPNQILRLTSFAQDRSALIVAMGIKTAEDDKPLILNFSETMARLGYVTFWPRLDVLDKGQSLPEEPDTFIKSFNYLSQQNFVSPKKISFMGFSVGSSVAMRAAEDPQISDKVHGLIFFGGYFDVFDYYISLATKTTQLNGQTLAWIPSPDAVSHAKGLLETGKANQLVKIFEASTSSQAYGLVRKAPKEEVDGLKKYNPKENLADFKASVFILHDQADTYVPYTESVRLNQALAGKVEKEFLLLNLFEHVQPNRPINVFQLAKLYGFLYKVLSSI